MKTYDWILVMQMDIKSAEQPKGCQQVWFLFFSLKSPLHPVTTTVLSSKWALHVTTYNNFKLTLPSAFLLSLVLPAATQDFTHQLKRINQQWPSDMHGDFTIIFKLQLLNYHQQHSALHIRCYKGTITEETSKTGQQPCVTTWGVGEP